MLALMREPESEVVDEKELERLKRDYLPLWAERDRGLRGGARGFPTEVPYIGEIRQFPSWGYQHDDVPDPSTCKLIDAAVDELTGLTGFGLARAALAVRYMSAGLPSVFRSGRMRTGDEQRGFTPMDVNEIEDLADRCERRLVPIVKRRGLPL